jgi:hypothetical protein
MKSVRREKNSEHIDHAIGHCLHTRVWSPRGAGDRVRRAAALSIRRRHSLCFIGRTFRFSYSSIYPRPPPKYGTTANAHMAFAG